MSHRNRPLLSTFCDLVYASLCVRYSAQASLQAWLSRYYTVRRSNAASALQIVSWTGKMSRLGFCSTRRRGMTAPERRPQRGKVLNMGATGCAYHRHACLSRLRRSRAPCRRPDDSPCGSRPFDRRPAGGAGHGHAVCVGSARRDRLGIVHGADWRTACARLGDMTAHGGVIVVGAPTVLIG